jgi:II/X family phage/plasmid replication protein
MIDWIKAVIPLQHCDALDNGKVMSISRDGNVDWQTYKRFPVRGSFESTLHIQSDYRTFDSETGAFSHIVFDGNPVKFFQGHNLWGTDNLVGLMVETILKVADILDLKISSEDWSLIKSGNYQLTRVDSTMMIDLGNQSDVQAFLYSAERTAHMRYKGQAISTKGTLYWGKNSRRESLKMYSKANEVRATGHKLPDELPDLPKIFSWVDGKLRIEACTRSMGLKQRGLQLACEWNENTPMEILNNLLKGLNMSEQHTLSADTLDGLKPRLVGVYHLWKEGHDLRKIYPISTFKRYRKQLQDAVGIDIAVKQGDRSEPNPNIIEFRRVLRPERCAQIPDWAVGTSLYFEPRKFG